MLKASSVEASPSAASLLPTASRDYRHASNGDAKYASIPIYDVDEDAAEEGSSSYGAGYSSGPSSRPRGSTIMGGMGDSARGFFAVRPRTIIVCVIALTLTILVVHDDSRGAAHTALKKVGVPLPDSLDDVRSGISGMLGGNGKGTSIWLPHSKPSSSDSYYHDEGDLAGGIQWQNTTAEHSSTSWGSPDEPVIDKMTYHHSNGYLLLPDPSKANSVKPLSEERHPILELIENAERKWDKLLKSQSKTLAEAVAEYKRRYQRNPPRGFDKWCVQMLCFHCALLTGMDARWDYAVKHDIVLKDEYDQIWRDTQVFWAL